MTVKPARKVPTWRQFPVDIHSPHEYGVGVGSIEVPVTTFIMVNNVTTLYLMQGSSQTS